MQLQHIFATLSKKQQLLQKGEGVTFTMRDGKEQRGVIMSIGRVNYRIHCESGEIYRVPFAMVRLARGPIRVPKLEAITGVETVLPLVLHESARLLRENGIELPVRYKARVWSTHFRSDSHVQYGERCLLYQLTPGPARDNVGSNLRRFRITTTAPARLAMLICHEIAHAVAHHRYGPHIAHHGRQFYSVLQELVETEFPEIRNRFTELLAEHTQAPASLKTA